MSYMDSFSETITGRTLNRVAKEATLVPANLVKEFEHRVYVEEVINSHPYDEAVRILTEKRRDYLAKEYQKNKGAPISDDVWRFYRCYGNVDHARLIRNKYELDIFQKYENDTKCAEQYVRDEIVSIKKERWHEKYDLIFIAIGLIAFIVAAIICGYSSVD